MTSEDEIGLDLPQLSARLEDLLVAEGLPSSCMGEFTIAPARCKVHTMSVRSELRLAEGVSVTVEHCGCDNRISPTLAVSATVDDFAKDIAKAVLAYWGRRDDAIAMLDAAPREFTLAVAKARLESRDCSLVSAELGTLYTSGHAPHVVTRFNLLGHHLSTTQWNRDYYKAGDLAKFFREHGPFVRYLAERRDELEVVGARGEIDAVAAAALRAAGKDPLKVAAYMTEGKFVLTIDIDGRPLRLWWQRGTIQGIFDLRPGVSWSYGEINFSAENVLPGRSYRYGEPIGEVMSLPFLLGHEGIIFNGCDVTGATRTLKVVPDTLRFGMKAGAAFWI